MAKNPKISIDVMGGDNGASTVIPGLDISLSRHPEVRFQLYGDEAVITPLLAQYPRVQEASEIFHTDVSVRMDDKPSQALRYGRYKSSMWRAIQAVKDGEVGAAVSAGNTGALMAMAKFCLRPMEGIERPAIAAIWPTLRGESIVLDMGATIGADAKALVDYAVMGEAMARSLFGLEHPSVGLLNVGVEEVKGLEPIKEAGQLLKTLDLPMRYHGFVEGDDIGRGTVDVVVTEGFTGNIALKTAEGTAKQIGDYLRQAMQSSFLTRIGYLFAKEAFDTLKAKMDPSNVNGGVFLGLNGIVIKSHGGTTPKGFASAIDVALDMVGNDLLAKIEEDMGLYRAALENKAPEEQDT